MSLDMVQVIDPRLLKHKGGVKPRLMFYRQLDGRPSWLCFTPANNWAGFAVSVQGSTPRQAWDRWLRYS